MSGSDVFDQAIFGYSFSGVSFSFCCFGETVKALLAVLSFGVRLLSSNRFLATNMSSIFF